MDIFETAARNKFRFPSVRGDLTAEQLFSLPLTSKDGFDLDSVAKHINAELKSVSEESFVTTRSSSSLQTSFESKLELVKYVIQVKLDANEAARAANERTRQRQALLAAIDNKKNEQMSQASLDDLEAQLAALG